MDTLGKLPNFAELNELASRLEEVTDTVAYKRLQHELLTDLYNFLWWEMRVRRNQYPPLSAGEYSYQDLVNELAVHLVDWVGSFDATRGVLLTAYMRRMIYGEIQHLQRQGQPRHWEDVMRIKKLTDPRREDAVDIRTACEVVLQDKTARYKTGVRDLLFQMDTHTVSLEDPIGVTTSGDPQLVGDIVPDAAAQEAHTAAFEEVHKAGTSRKLHKKHQYLLTQLLEGKRFTDLDFGEPVGLAVKAIRLSDIFRRVKCASKI